MEVVPGIYQLHIPVLFAGSKDTNVYLVRGDQGWLMVDAGWNMPKAWQALQQQLKEAGLSFEDISQIVITHVHPDHYGLADKVKGLSHARLALHRKEKELLDARYMTGYYVEEMAQWLRKNGVTEEELADLTQVFSLMADSIPPTKAETILLGGELISTGAFQFEVIWTPGHAPGHICLYERRRRILLSGDHILPTITTNIGIHLRSGSSPLDDYLGSLNKLKGLEVDLILPAHEHIFQGLEERIAELFQHHRERAATVVETVKGEPKTAYQIATEVPWMQEFGGAGWQTLGPLERRLAIGETLSHLESLRLRGVVGKISRNGVVFYHSLPRRRDDN